MKMQHFAVMSVSVFIAIGAVFLAQHQPPPEVRARADGTTNLARAESVGVAPPVAMPKVKVWPASSTARASLTPNPADQQMLDGMRLADHFDELVKRARSEPAFAQTFAFALYQCSIQERSYASLERRMAKMTAEKVASNTAKYEADFAKCKGLSSDQVGQRFDFAEAAARAGVLEAQLYYRSQVGAAMSDGSVIRTPGAMDRYRQNVEAFSQAAARSGDPRGAALAYDIYTQGIFVPPDLVRAYEYAEEFARLSPGPRAQSQLDDVARRMTPDELR